ncbi:MAG: DNA topoisomerase [Peptococcaceae bacterium]|jgi:DNA topoisomerase-3|nr:DNA topoisomerase [Peptococcaceae bacterium]
MVPEKFQLQPITSTAAYLSGLTRLLSRKDVGTVVNACDAGREGELIFKYIMRYAGCQKSVKRLWLSENTPGAVLAAFSRLRDGSEMVNLGTAAELRACADWLIGMNATRAYTVRHAGFGNVLLVGRVQTPTLALLVQRGRDIRAFQFVAYWQLVAQFSTGAGETYAGTWTRDDRDRFPTMDQAQQIQRALGEVRHARVSKVDQRDMQESPPQLCDLTTLQRDANKRYGLMAKQALDAAQALYEWHKLLTYPRTDSRHLTSSLAGTLPERVAAVTATKEYPTPPTIRLTDKRFVDDSNVTDHHAIIPTTTRPDLAALSPAERQVYDLVARRFLAAFFPAYRFR